MTTCYENPPLCECGCDRPVNKRKKICYYNGAWAGEWCRFIRGHDLRTRKGTAQTPLCKCGCGGTVSTSSAHQHKAWNQYIIGHNIGYRPRRMISLPCACGCGEHIKTYYKTDDEKGKTHYKRHYKFGHLAALLGVSQRENRAAYSKARYHRENKRERANRQALRREVLSHYSGGQPRCTCCGEATLVFLTIDHIVPVKRNSKNNASGTAGEALCRRLKRDGYPDGFQVLCYNCNCAKKVNSVCPHQMVLRENQKGAACQKPQFTLQS